MRPLRELARTVDDPPPDRDRYIDLLRLATIAIVIFSHWLAAVVTEDAQNRPMEHSALPSLPWAAPFTWLFQWVPVFFVVTGCTDAALLRVDRRKGRGATSWLQSRGGRLVPTATVLLLVIAAGAAVATLAGADPVAVRGAVRTATMPLWFLTVYLVLVVLTPVMHRLHERFGVWVIVVLVVLVGLGDTARFAGISTLAAGNYLFGWLAIHQAGFFWQDGRLRFNRRTSLALLAGSLAVVVLLTVPGPYPVTMIDVEGQQTKNVAPPSLALLALTAAHLCVVFLLRDRAERWLRRRRPWQFVVFVNGVALTTFLWHMSAVLVVFGPLWAAHALPRPPVGSWDWWAWRVPWLLLLTVALAVLVVVFGSVELRLRGDEWPHLRVPARLHLPLAVAGYLAAIAGLMVNSLVKPSDPQPLGLPVATLACFLSGALVLRLLRGSHEV